MMPRRACVKRRDRHVGGPRFAALVMGICALFAAPSAMSAYIVDTLLVGLHESNDAASAIIKVIPTGSEVAIVERADAFVKVQTTDGTAGWLDASYVTETPPAQLQLTAAEADLARRQVELDTAKANVARLTAQVDVLTSNEDGSRNSEIDVLRKELDAAIEQARLFKEEGALRELAAKQDAAAELEALRAQLAAQTRSPVAGAPVSSTDLRELQRLAEENRRLKNELDDFLASRPAAPQETSTLLPWTWSVSNATSRELAIIGLIVLLAFAIGAGWRERAFRKRLGGYSL